MYYWCAHCQQYKIKHNNHTCMHHTPPAASPGDHSAFQHEEANDDFIKNVDKDVDGYFHFE